MMIINKLSKATNTITTHFCFTAINIKHSHFKIIFLWRQNNNHSITSNSKMTITYLWNKSFIHRNILMYSIKINIIIANSFHFCEFQHTLTSSLFVILPFFYHHEKTFVSFQHIIYWGDNMKYMLKRINQLLSILFITLIFMIFYYHLV